MKCAVMQSPLDFARVAPKSVLFGGHHKGALPPCAAFGGYPRALGQHLESGAACGGLSV